MTLTIRRVVGPGRVAALPTLAFASACAAPGALGFDSEALGFQEASTTESRASSTEPYDPSDPTRVDTRAGAGFKYTGYDPDGYLLEMRGKLAVQLNPQDLFVIDIGVGQNHSVPGQSDEIGLTDGRFRYFRMWDVDRSVAAGWQGWGTSLELQTPGTVPGTDGSGLVALGGMGAFGLGEGFAAFVNPIISSVWTSSFDEHLGVVLRGDLFLTYKPGGLWRGAYLKAKPSVSYGVSQALEGELTANLELAVGGAFTKVFWWDLQWREFFMRDLERATEGRESGVAADGSLYLSFTYFF